MPSLFPCAESLKDCDCSNFPVQNFSQEAPDQNHCFSNYTAPPVVGTFFEPSCFVQCTEVIVGTAAECEELVEECAARAGVDCVGNPPGVPPGPPDSPNPPFFPGRSIYQNSFQSCTVTCPDGGTFTESVPAGTIHSLWQADADARAYALACKRANAKRVCFITDAALDSICANVAGTVTFDVFGGQSPYTYAHTGGTLPTGMTLDGNGILFGTPTTGGSYTFEVTVTDAVGSTQVKEFTIKIVEIVSPTALPNATQNASYNYTLLSLGTTGTTSWVHVSGTFPSGLLLNLSTGVLMSDISGITEAGDFSFTLRIKDGNGIECDKAFTLHVASAVGLLAYWAFEFQDGDLIDDLTGHNYNLAGATGFGIAIVPGKVANGMQNLNASQLDFLPGTVTNTDFDNPGTNGVTVCGWIFISAPSTTGVVFEIQYWDGIGPPNFSLYLEATAGKLSFYWSTDFSVSADCPTVLTGGWHFYRAWLDPVDTMLKLQIDDGTIFTSIPNAWVPVPFNQFRLSTTTLSAYYDEMGYWKRVLTSTEASNLYNGGAGITFGNPNMPP